MAAMIKITTKLLVSSVLVLSLANTTTYAGRASTPASNAATSIKGAHVDKTDVENTATGIDEPPEVNGDEKTPTEKTPTEKTPSEASSPSLNISGFTAVTVYGVSQRNRTNGKGAGYHLANDVSDLYFIISGKSETGLTYKYQLTFEAIPGEGLFVAQNFVELQKGVTVQLGAAADITRAMLQDGSRLMGATGGFSAPLDRVFNISSGVFYNFRALGESKYATKIVLWSPEWQGVRVAFGFTPNTAHIGDSGLNTAGTGTIKSPGNSKGIYPSGDNGPFGVHHMSFGMNYNREIGDFNVKLSAVKLFDRSYVVNTTGSTYYRTRVRGTESYQLGGIIGYGKYQLGGGWLDNGRSRLPFDGNLSIAGISLGDTWKGNSGKAWNLAANYTHGAYQFAVGHQNTFRRTDAVNRATSNITSVTAGVTPLQGLKLYVEADYIRTKTNPGSVALAEAINGKTARHLTHGIGNNKGIVTLTGITLSF
jgi:hypothetical protein